jgi:hypothetical protein
MEELTLDAKHDDEREGEEGVIVGTFFTRDRAVIASAFAFLIPRGG